MLKNKRSESQGVDLIVGIIITEIFLWSASLKFKAEKNIEVEQNLEKDYTSFNVSS